MMVHDYNPSYLGGGDQEDHSLRLAYLNSLENPISNNGQEYPPVIPVLQESTNKNYSSGQQRNKARLYFKSNQHKKGWPSGSSDKVLA
jgi:hypothetical protein